MGVRGRPTKWDAWYSKPRWARIRRHQLLGHPLCAFCLERGIVEPATICDHVEPHHGEVNKFWLGPFNGPGNNGSSIRNGVSYQLKAGDVVIIPAGTGHWFTKIDNHITYLMMRIDPDKVTPHKDEAASQAYIRDQRR